MNKTHLKNLKQHLKNLAELPDGWDGFEGFAPSKKIATHAWNLLVALPFHLVERLSINDIDPFGNGTISIVWRAKDGEFSLEIGEQSASCYLKMGSEIRHVNDDMKPVSSRFLIEIYSLLNRLFPETSFELSPPKLAVVDSRKAVAHY